MRTFDGLDRTLSDFHAWALGDLLSNTTRGMLAEYLVRCALGLDAQPAPEWDHVDIRTASGTIEVKFSGWIQSWGTGPLSKPRFDIARRRWQWDALTNEWRDTNSPARAADIYVFCLHDSKERAVASPLKIDQWCFWIAPTPWLDIRFGDQKSVGLSTISAELQRLSFSQLQPALKEGFRSSAQARVAQLIQPSAH